MSMLTLEKRQTNYKSLYTTCLVALSIGLPIAFILPRLIDAHDAKPLCLYNGAEYTIEDDGGDTVAIMSPGLPSRAVPRDDVTIIPRWQFWRYSSAP